MKTAIYKNRYNEDVEFTLDEEQLTVTMKGYSNQFIRFSHANNYSEAYLKYTLDCAEKGKEIMSEAEFEKKAEDEYSFFVKYSKYVKPSDRVSMVDPPGGPYVQLDSNLAYYLGMDAIISVKKINLLKGEVLFDVEINKNL
jgi:hypothetical protein